MIMVSIILLSAFSEKLSNIIVNRRFTHLQYDVWATEYETQTTVLKNRITNLKQQKKHCRLMKQSEELSSRIDSLYTMYLESKHTGELLRQRAIKEHYHESISQR